jgi:hypothetical protein
MSTEPRIVYCHCAYAKVVPEEVKQEVLRQLTASGVSFDAVADLCEMAARRDPWLAEVACGGPARIAACYPRAVKWLFASAGSPLPDTGIQILNMRTESAAAITSAVVASGEVEAS